ncbi:MAG: thioredoxin-disulfide reductase [Deltaproteobacteria bacterium]|nr:thioredoxin-disulfide reductase [Deltaproteobacteria bacterium]
MGASEPGNIVIIGSGPAGLTAAIYASRAGHEPLLFEGVVPGGQLTITTEVENFPGFEQPLSGSDLMARMRAQAERVGAKIVSETVDRVDLSRRPFRMQVGPNEVLARALILATGAQARWLDLPSEDRFRGMGVSACATCDGFFFRGKKVAVVGGGDTACEDAVYLAGLASEVILVHRRGELRAAKVAADRVLRHPRIKVAWHRVVDEILGDATGVKGVRLKDPRDGRTEELAFDGVFVAIGHVPSTALVAGQLELDPQGYIVTRPGGTHTSVPGVFAAGDVRDTVYRQAITAAGTGCMAAIDAARFLDEERQGKP